MKDEAAYCHTEAFRRAEAKAELATARDQLLELVRQMSPDATNCVDDLVERATQKLSTIRWTSAYLEGKAR